jgi:hypothetical protein
MRSPVATEPVKLTKRVRGSSTSASPMPSVGAGEQVDDAGGPARLLDALHEHAGDDGRDARRLEDDVLPAATGPMALPTRIASGKFHGGMTSPTPIGSSVVTFSSPGYGCVTRGSSSSSACARVVLDEVDRLGDVGVGLAVVLAGLVGLPGAELELAAAHDRRERHSARARAAAGQRDHTGKPASAAAKARSTSAAPAIAARPTTREGRTGRRSRRSRRSRRARRR